MSEHKTVLLCILLLIAYLLSIAPVHAVPFPQEGNDAILRVINESEATICYVLICPSGSQEANDCAAVAETTILPEETEAFDITAGNYDVFLVDCDANFLLVEQEISITTQHALRFTSLDLCEAFGQAGMELYRQAQHQDAIQKSQESLICYREANERQGEVIALNYIGFIYNSLSQYAEALDYYQQALAISREIGDRAGEGIILNNIGGIHARLGEYEAALGYHEQAFTIQHDIGDRAGEGLSLNNIGGMYESLEEYEAALGYYKQALAISHEIGDREGEGINLHNTGANYTKLGEYETALGYYEQALAIRREVGDQARESHTLYDIGSIYDKLGEYETALGYYEQALAIRCELGDRAGEGITLHDIGFIYARLGEYEAALGYYKQALTIRREIGDRTGVGITLNNIGRIYDRMGKYEVALAYYEQAHAISREVGNQAEEGTPLNNIGLIYYRLGKYEAALAYYEQALAISREIGDRAGEGIARNNIGTIYDRLGEYETALGYYGQAITILRETGNRSGEGINLHNTGLIHDSLKEHEVALVYYEQALTIFREIEDREGEGGTLNNIGTTYADLGEYKAALGYHEQALAIRREIGDRVGEGISLNNIGGIYESLGEYEAALATYEQALTVLESVRTTAGSEGGRASFIAQYADLYDRVVALYYTQNWKAEAFFTTERGRARAFLDALATGYVQLSDTAADLYAREVEAYAVRQTAQQALIQARAQWPDDTALLADLEAQLAQAEADYETAQAAIIAHSDQLTALVPGRSGVLELSQVQMHLDDETVLVAYWVLRDENRVLAFVITRDALNTVAVDVPYDDLVAAINDFRNFASLEATHPSSLVQLYDWLIAPLREYLVMPHLAIIPHDVLHYLPFAALTDGERFLVEDYVITYLPSASALPFIQENAGRAGGAPLILGNPTTGDYDAVASFATERDGLGPLPFAEWEAQAVAALYGAPAYVGAAATEGLVRQMAGESGLLHLAAHGKYNPVAPLNSLIALAPDDEHDGWLTVGEVYGLDLQQANLVVLSACESQLGDLSRGDELVGMTRAFIYAGTPTVIASLWTVEDQATAQLMEHFYTHLRAGMGKAAALRQAQLDIQAEYPNPYYWAAFVLSGDGGEVRADAVGGRFTPDARTSRWIWLGGGTALCASLGCFGGVGLLLIVVWATRKEKRRG